MDRLRQVLASIGESLSGLSTVGRVAIGLAMTVVVLMLVLVAVFTSRETYVPLLEGLPPAAQREAQATAASMGIRTSFEGGQLKVETGKRELLLSTLRESGKISEETILFANLAAHQNWMNSREMNNQLASQALQNELARSIKTFVNVADASVFIDAPDAVGIGLAHRKPTAVVSVLTKGGKPLSQPLVDAIAGLVAGAKAGLMPGDVRVVDASNGRQHRMKADGEFVAGDYMEHVARIEDRVQNKLHDTLSYIDGVIVAVNAHADVRKVSSTETRMLPDKKGSVSILSRTTTKETSSSNASSGADAGVRSNVQADISTGGATGTRTADASEDSEFRVEVGRLQQNTIDPRGMPTKLNVTINVPRDYVIKLIQKEKKDDKAEPDQAEIDQRFATEKQRIESDIRPLVETMAVDASEALAQTQPGTVVVSMRALGGAITTMGLGGATMASMGAGSGGGGGGLLGELTMGSLVKNVLLGLLSVGALGMMLMLVKKAAKPVELPSAQEIVGLPPALEAGGDIVGEADEGATAMEGVELDDDQLKVKKMLETIGQMVKDKPSDAAGLLNRWLQVDG
ncbi:MAG: flagellar M-ring protein FliF C-terminal domain-containing protein [Phycisphaerales bacterium]